MAAMLHSNTHALTARFQQVLRNQFSMVDHRHRSVTDAYKARVTTAMLAAQRKLDRLRDQLAEAHRTIADLERQVLTVDALQHDNEALRDQIVQIEARHDDEKDKLNAKVKFLRSLIAQNGTDPSATAAPSSMRDQKRRSTSGRKTTSPTKAPVRPARRAASVASTTATVPDALVASDAGRTRKSTSSAVPQPEADDAVDPEASAKPPPSASDNAEPIAEEGVADDGGSDDDDDDDEQPNSEAEKLLLELEKKQEKLAELMEQNRLLSESGRQLTSENGVLHERLAATAEELHESRQHLQAETRRMTTLIEQLQKKIADDEASVTRLTESEHHATAVLKKTLNDMKVSQEAASEHIASLKSEVARLAGTLKRCRRSSMSRSLLFQAHLMQMERSVLLCNKIDEYLALHLTCRTCFNVFRKPQVLYPCGHTICETCIESIKDVDSGRILCNDCSGICESITVSNTVLDAILSQFNWWKVSLGDIRLKREAARDTLKTSEDADDDGVFEYARAVSDTANEANPLLRKSIATLSNARRQHTRTGTSTLPPIIHPK